MIIRLIAIYVFTSVFMPPVALAQKLDPATLVGKLITVEGDIGVGKLGYFVQPFNMNDRIFILDSNIPRATDMEWDTQKIRVKGVLKHYDRPSVRIPEYVAQPFPHYYFESGSSVERILDEGESVTMTGIYNIEPGTGFDYIETADGAKIRFVHFKDARQKRLPPAWQNKQVTILSKLRYWKGLPPIAGWECPPPLQPHYYFDLDETHMERSYK